MPPSVIPPRPVSTARPKPPDAGRVSRNFGPASRQTSEIPVTSSGWPITSACDEWEGILGNALRLYDEMALFESVLARIVSDGSLGRFSRAHVKETDRVKLLGFYVDLDDQMRVRSTPSQVTSELAKDHLNFARDVLETLRSISLIWTASQRCGSIASPAVIPPAPLAEAIIDAPDHECRGPVGPSASASGPHPSWSVQRMAPMRRFQMGATGPPPWRLAKFGFFAA